MEAKFKQTLVRGFDVLGLNLQVEQAEQMQGYAELLLDWNQKINLTAITDPDEVALKHFVDSLSVAKYISFSGGTKKLMDVGTGAGFPGLPLKIMYPNLNVTLLDSLQKRCNFLQTVVDALGLKGVSVVHGRAEEMGQDDAFREKFDFSLARAVTKMPVLSEYCIPFLKVGGTFIAFKGPGAAEETAVAKKAIDTLGGRLSDTCSFQLPISGEERVMLIIEKIRKTPSVYPRRPGTPEKSPLL